jgi:hypothetical protein
MKSALAFQRAWRTGFRQQPIAWACLLIGACLILTMVPRQAQGLGANETQAKNMLNLDSVFIYPNGSRKFEAELWKRDNKSRFAMLFDLYHLPLSKSTPEQIYSLLGLPDDTQKDYGGGRSALSVYYDVGLKYGLQTFLSVFFRDGKLESLGIQQRSEKRFRQQNQYPAWQLQNQNWKTIAHEYNRNYFIVGMPVKLISLVAGYNPTDSSSAEDGFKKVATASSNDRVHCFGPFEFEYSLDNEKVARFRIAYGTESGKSKYTDWEDKDLRTDPRCLVRHSEYYNLKLRGEVFLGSFMPFSKTTWSGDGIRGVASINLRNAMVNDLVRSLPIMRYKVCLANLPPLPAKKLLRETVMLTTK